MNVALCLVLASMAGILGWIGFELRAIRRILQARFGGGKSSDVKLANLYLNRIAQAITDSHRNSHVL